MPPVAQDFVDSLDQIFSKAVELGLVAIEVKSGNLHRRVGGYPGDDHRMPVCCGVMRKEMKGIDSVMCEPPSGKGANLVIRYILPRP